MSIDRRINLFFNFQLSNFYRYEIKLVWVMENRFRERKLMMKIEIF